MPRHPLILDDDSEQDNNIQTELHNLPHYDPLGFLDVIPQRGQNPIPIRSQVFDPPRRDIDVIRDEVNEWMDGAEFGMEGVPEVEVSQAEMAAVEHHEIISADSNLDTHDHVENVLAASVEVSEPGEAEEPPPLDPVAEAILQTSAEKHGSDIVNSDHDEGNNNIFETTLADDSEELYRIPEDLELSDFQNALGIWVDLHNISRAAYSQLVEVLHLAKNIDDLQTIPRWKDTLKSKMHRSLPLGKLRRSTVNLDVSKLPTRSKSTEKVLSIDLEDTLSTLLSSSRVFSQIYRGMAHRTTHVHDPWEAPWWGESIRTTSGLYHRYRDGGPILPSDFVIWGCEPGHTDHYPDRCHEHCQRTHLGRVVWSGQDRTQGDEFEQPLLLVQRVYQRGEYIPFHLIHLTAKMSHSPTVPGAHELVIVEDSTVSLHPRHIISQLTISNEDIHLDYTFSCKESDFRPRPCTAPYTVRYIWNEGRMQVRELRYSSPHRAELELRALGRKYVVENFANRQVISLPLHMFVDAFGLYRNMYRSIEGLYFFPQFFETRLRNRRSSVFTATLGPYGAKRADIFKTIAHASTRLDRGTKLDVGGREMFVCSFVAAIIGDMPSQQELSGCLGPAANYPCRYCLVSSPQKGDMDFDVSRLGKYHDQIVRDRSRVIEKTHAPTTRKIKLAGLGLHDNEALFSTLRGLFPALDVIRSRPIDAAHSEYAGISKYLHRLIFQEASSLLTRTAVRQAAECDTATNIFDEARNDSSIQPIIDYGRKSRYGSNASFPSSFRERLRLISSSVATCNNLPAPSGTLYRLQ
ncbi:hypothetical protein GGS21DRAFT_492604 [Xylaria nigripes]|nr:hypothetical protein GGS21DRAFT_492604 [Xylaria nigripes]